MATSFKPFDAFKQTPDSHRSIWHVVPQSPQTVRMINEKITLPIASDGYQVKSGGLADVFVSIQKSGLGYSLYFGPDPRAAIGTNNIHSDFSGPPLAVGTMAQLVAVRDVAASMITRPLYDPSKGLSPQFQPPLNDGVFKFRFWNFVPVTSVVGGPLVTLPRCALGRGQLTTTSSIDNLKCLVSHDSSTKGFKEVWTAAYGPGLATCRFRLVSYGPIFLAINDLSRRVIANDGKHTVDLSEVSGASHWLQVANNKIVALANQSPLFWQLILNMKDIAERLKPWYTILGNSIEGYPIVLSARNGATIATPYDPFDAAQSWKYYDSGSCKYCPSMNLWTGC